MKFLNANQQAVDRALRSAEMPLTIREIAERVGLSRSAAQGVVMALVRYGAAEQKGVAMSSPGVTFASIGHREDEQS